MRTAIRDRQYKVLGWIESEDGLGRTRLLDYSQRTIGWYDRRRGVTIDDRGWVVGQGDQLLRLLR